MSNHDSTPVTTPSKDSGEDSAAAQKPANNPLPHQTLDWGTCAYDVALERQLELVKARQQGEIGDTLVFVEHPPVYTIGRRIGANQHLLWDENRLREEGIQLFETTRGGDITYHAPGQLVGYPIVDLTAYKDLHGWLRFLEEVLMRTIWTFGLVAGRREGKTGIWLEDRKIAAMGVAVKQWVTYHGFALNVNVDLSGFNGIVPCGITDGSVTSLQKELGIEIPLSDVKSVFTVEFWKLFPDIGKL